MADYRQEALKELARRELESRAQEPRSLLQRAANDVEQNINQPIEKFGRAARDMAGGFGQGIVNTPSSLWNLGAMGANAVGLHTPEAPTLDLAPHNINSKAGELASMFAAPEAAFGAISKGLGSLSKPLSALSHNPKNLFATKNTIKNSLLEPHDFLEKRASQAFKHVSNQANSRGINKLTINPSQEILPEGQLSHGFFDDLKEYLPRTRASTNLLNQAKTGDYNSIRKLQTDLYTRAKQNLSSGLEADRLRGAEMLEKRNDINQGISSHFKKSDAHDLDKILNEARNDWSTLQNRYYNENIPNSLIKMFDKDVRKVPNNLVNLLSEESIPMNNLLEAHPGVKQKVIGNKIGKNALKKLIKYGIPAGTAIAGYEYGKH